MKRQWQLAAVSVPQTHLSADTAGTGFGHGLQIGVFDILGILDHQHSAPGHDNKHTRYYALTHS